MRDDAPVADDDDGVGAEGFELSAEVLIVFDLFRLSDRQADLERFLLYRRCGEFQATAAGPVGLGHNQRNAVTGTRQSVERRHGELRSAAEHELERFGHDRNEEI